LEQEGTNLAPTTTLGNISSWVAHDLQSSGPEISHSITCSTALHAVLNGVAWLKSGMVDKFWLVGGEAPLTDYNCTNACFKNLFEIGRGLSNRALDLQKTKHHDSWRRSMFVVEIGKKRKCAGFHRRIGYATEILEHNISISAKLPFQNRWL
jgi:hypothetical protein